ncbi:MAG TPA: putative Ig domain-containing protein [Nocardioides sp.]|nr:putative Ig domain-containing protein [Nocardioides sp.]
MSRLGNVRRTALVTGLGTVAAIAATGLLATAPAHAAGTPDPYAPSYHHAYRHGAVPTLEVNAKMKAWQHANAAATGPKTLSYGGGVDGIGVQSGHSKVYLVFYGTQWGTQTTTNGISSFSGDPDHAAEAVQNMFKGIGTNNELWSADLTQWCDGPNVATGATSCPSNAAFIPYQSGGVLSGVWYDNSKASPSSATSLQLGQEAVTAAGHFGNTTAASNRDAYYVILSPHGTNPDNYQSPTQGYCAWHDWNGDVGATSSYGDIAFSNQPYNMDVGSSCGVNFVNSGSAGTLDGYTMTLGHEWHEMMSDQNPAGGWTNHTGGTYNGQENSDECAWIAAGSTGGAANITFATGTFAEQASWSNDTNSCAISHPIVGGGSTGNTVTVTNPGSQTGTVGTAKSLQMSATDSASGQTFTWSATGLPAGLSINASSGLISGTPTTAATYNTSVTAKDTTGATGSTSFTFTIGSGGGTGCTGQLLGNPGFETGTAAPWTASSGVIDSSASEPAHSGSWKAWLDGYGSTHTDSVSQTVTIPAGCTATLGYYLHIDTQESGTTAYDKLTVSVNGTTKTTWSNANAANGYTLHTLSLSSYAGTTVTIKFTGTEDSSLATSFVLDDTSLNLS